MTQPHPVAPAERMPWMDVLRGVALLGILLMNVELFNRAFPEAFTGLDPAAAGLDRIADWLVYVFVRGKFWIMFSLLFGAGFALMLMRAQAAGHGFVALYLRRIAALAGFGLLHMLLLWHGDILFLYAINAGMLLLALFGRLRHGLALAALLVLAALGLSQPGLLSYLVLLTVAGLTGVYLRSERRVRIGRLQVPLISLLLAALALLPLVGGPLAALFTGDGGNAFGMLMGAAVLVLAWIAWRHRDPARRRPLQFGIAWYAMPLATIALLAALELARPAPADATRLQARAGTPAAAAEPDDASAPDEADRIARYLAEVRADVERERAALSAGSYLDTVRVRVSLWSAKTAVGGQVLTGGFGVFLVGLWLARSGLVLDPRAHRPALRRLLWAGLGVGAPLTAASALLPMSHPDGSVDAAFRLHAFLHMLGGLPLSLAYLAAIVLALQHARGAAWLGCLAPVGRMPLSKTTCCSRWPAPSCSTAGDWASGACRAAARSGSRWRCSRCRCC